MTAIKGRPWTQEDSARLVRMEQNHVPRAEMSVILNRSRKALTSRLQKLGEAKHRRRPWGSLMALVKRFWKPGRSDTDIADMIDCDYVPSVTKVRKALGLPCGLTASERARIGINYRHVYNRAKRLK